MGMSGHFQNLGGVMAQSPEDSLCSYWGPRMVQGMGGLLGAWYGRFSQPQPLPRSMAPPLTESSC